MSEDPTGPDRYGLAALLRPRGLLSLALIGLIVLAFLAALAFAGGAFSPHRLTQTAMIDRFEQVNGVHPGFRRNHAKGVCVTGWFDASGQAQPLSRAEVFRPGRTPVVGRFALGVGAPDVADSPHAVRSLALDFRSADGAEWRTGMNDIPVFPLATPRAFYDQLLAGKADPATGKPDPARFKAFLARYPETARALKLIAAQPVSSGFADASYNSLNAFWLVDAHGARTPVRWSMVAVQPFAPEPAAQPAGDPNYLFDALAQRMRAGPLQWRLVLTLGQPGDPTDDATRPWPAERRQVDAGTLTLNHIEAEGPGGCRDINYDPLILPPGIAPSGDPLLSARSAAYSTSFTRRAGEPKTPSPVQVGAAPVRGG